MSVFTGSASQDNKISFLFIVMTTKHVSHRPSITFELANLLYDIVICYVKRIC